MDKIFRHQLCYLFVLNVGVTLGADIPTMESDLRNYFSKTRHHDVDQAYKDRAMNIIYGEFKKLGLETVLQEFQVQRISTEKNFTNVIGILKGEHFGKLSDRIVGVAAHYDTVSTTAGVDDNGAGVVAMLDVARSLTEMNKAGRKRNNTIMFVSFDVEEQGLYGSEAFVDQWLPKFMLDNYGPEYTSIQPYGVIVMDTMMEYNTSTNSQLIPHDQLPLFQTYFPTVSHHLQEDQFQGDFLVLTYRNDSVDYELGRAFNNAWKSLGRQEFEIEAFPLPISDVTMLQRVPALSQFLRSDHTSFWRANLSAIFLSDSANFRGDMIHCYHHPCDNLDVMLTDDNIRFLGKTADSITKTLDQLSAPYQSDVSTGVVSLPSFLLLVCCGFLTMCIGTLYYEPY